ncbi:MAG: hypothetical protein AAF402_04145 [Pseudomonadota bacterium]
MDHQNSTRDEQQKVLTKRFDLSGNSVIRQLSIWFRSKWMIMGKMDTGPGLRNLIIMALLHYGGKPLFTLRNWWQSRYRLRARVKRLLGRSV